MICNNCGSYRRNGRSEDSRDYHLVTHAPVVKGLQSFVDSYEPKDALVYYPGSGCDASASRVFDNVLYLDIRPQTIECLQKAGLAAHLGNVKEFDPGLVDIIIVLNPGGFGANEVIDHLRPGGYLICNDYHQTASDITGRQMVPLDEMDQMVRDMQIADGRVPPSLPELKFLEQISTSGGAEDDLFIFQKAQSSKLYARRNPSYSSWRYNPETEIHKALKNYFGVDKYLGGGDQGVVYSLIGDPYRVLKITDSEKEAVLAAWLMENPRPMTFPVVEKVYKVEGKPEFTIIREEIPSIKPLGSPYWHAIQAVFSPRPEGPPIKMLELYESVDDSWQSMPIHRIRLDEAAKAYREVITNDGIYIKDSVSENLGLRPSSGEPVIRDFGSPRLAKTFPYQEMLNNIPNLLLSDFLPGY